MLSDWHKFFQKASEISFLLMPMLPNVTQLIAMAVFELEFCQKTKLVAGCGIFGLSSFKSMKRKKLQLVKGQHL